MAENERGTSDRLVDLGVDYAKDWAIGQALDVLTEKARIPFERFSGNALKGSAGKMASKLASPMASSAIELGKGAMLLPPDAREGFAEEGKALMEEPSWFQAGNLALNPAEALAKYGAVSEENSAAAMKNYIKQNSSGSIPDIKEIKRTLAETGDKQTQKEIDEIARQRNLRESNERMNAAIKELGLGDNTVRWNGLEKKQEFDQQKLAEENKNADKEITMNMISSYFKNYG